MGGYMEEAHAYSHLHRLRLTALAGKKNKKLRRDAAYKLPAVRGSS